MTILDTNVLSELMKKKPDANVFNWLSSEPAGSLFTTTINQAEILYGLQLLPQSQKRQKLEKAANAVFADDFKGRLLPFDEDSARAYSVVAAHRRSIGHPISQFDAQIAAIARSRGARLATRNMDDFEDCGIDLINPWKRADTA